MQEISDYLPFLIPIIVIQLALQVFTIHHILKHPNYRIGNKALWIIIVLLGNIIGPVVYFAIGKGEE